MSIIDNPPQLVNPEYEPEDPVALVVRKYTPSAPKAGDQVFPVEGSPNRFAAAF